MPPIPKCQTVDLRVMAYCLVSPTSLSFPTTCPIYCQCHPCCCVELCHGLLSFVTLYHLWSWSIVFCHIVSSLVMVYCLLSHCITSGHGLLSFVTLYHLWSWSIAFCHIVSSLVMVYCLPMMLQAGTNITNHHHYCPCLYYITQLLILQASPTCKVVSRASSRRVCTFNFGQK